MIVRYAVANKLRVTVTPEALLPAVVRNWRGFPCREVSAIAYARIIRQWADGTVIVSEVGSDLDTVDELIVAAARLDALPDEAES